MRNLESVAKKMAEQFQEPLRCMEKMKSKSFISTLMQSSKCRFDNCAVILADITIMIPMDPL